LKAATTTHMERERERERRKNKWLKLLMTCSLTSGGDDLHFWCKTKRQKGGSFDPPRSITNRGVHVPCMNDNNGSCSNAPTLSKLT